VHVEGERGGGAGPGDLAERVHVGDGIGAKAAGLPRDGEGEQAGVVEVLVVLVGEGGLRVVAGGPAGDAPAAGASAPRAPVRVEGRHRASPSAGAYHTAVADCGGAGWTRNWSCRA
jgi:hypothetical protein